MAGWVVFAFVGGLVMGSFATAVAHRVPRGISIVLPRSQCPACGVQIAAYDNIPVASWVLLGGRARCCGARISPRYPLTELATGLLFAATTIVYRDDPAQMALGLVLVTTLITVTLTDLEQWIIPNKVLLVATLIGVALVAVFDPSSLPERALAATAGGGLLFLVLLIYPSGMGLGDVKLAAVLGFFLGRNIAPALLAAFLAGSAVGLALIAREGSSARKKAIPFGPFLALGGLVGLLLGNEILDWYLGTF